MASSRRQLLAELMKALAEAEKRSGPLAGAVIEGFAASWKPTDKTRTKLVDKAAKLLAGMTPEQRKAVLESLSATE